jgi:hypothetical protein
MTFSVNKEQEERNRKLTEVIKQYDNGDAGFDEVKDAIIEDLFNGLQSEATYEPVTILDIENMSKMYCGTCGEEFQHWHLHSCSPHLLKRIEALEAIVNRFICDGK